MIPALGLLLAAQADGTGAFLRTGARTDVLLACGGLVTIAPLLLFASAVQRVPLSIVGLLQNVSPTIQFLLGLLVYGESFTSAQFYRLRRRLGGAGAVRARRPPRAALASRRLLAAHGRLPGSPHVGPPPRVSGRGTRACVRCRGWRPARRRPPSAGCAR